MELGFLDLEGAAFIITKVKGLLKGKVDIESTMDGASEDRDGNPGLVPKPKAGEEGKYLRGDGTWADGAQGPPGEKGDKGDPGATGAKGATGAGITTAVSRDAFTESQWNTFETVGHTATWNDTSGIRNGTGIGDVFFVTGTSTDEGRAHIAIYQSDTASGDLHGKCIGHAAADRGDKGDTGATGPQGSKGDTGAKGAAGTNGTSAAWFTGTAVTGTSTSAVSVTVSGSKAGDMYLNTSTYNVYRASAASSWIYVCNIKGATGAKGATGSQGPTGATGATGPQGAAGAKGATGTRGSMMYWGTAITGTSTTATVFSGSGVSSAIVNDLYLNTSTFNIYQCTTAGAASVAKWVYRGCIKGATGATGATGPQGPKITISYASETLTLS